MPHGNESREEMMAALRDLVERIERDGGQEVTLKFMLDDGERELYFSLRTEEERQLALVALRTILGQIH